MDTQTKRLSSKTLTNDRDVLKVLKGMEGYNASSANCSVDSLSALEQDLDAKKEIRLQKEGEAKAARDNEVAAEHAFHQAILGAKSQVRSLFGDNSNELQSIGLKKKTERKSPKRKTV